jgi:hypothetical protein
MRPSGKFKARRRLGIRVHDDGDASSDEEQLLTEGATFMGCVEVPLQVGVGTWGLDCAGTRMHVDTTPTDLTKVLPTQETLPASGAGLTSLTLEDMKWCPLKRRAGNQVNPKTLLVSA